MPNPDYRKMFEDLDPFYPQPNELNDLATIMSGRARFSDAVLASFAAPHKIEPQPIPAGYTYLGQFIIHDISFDERSDRHTRDDLPWEIICSEQINKLKNLRKPTFDLETVYGYEEPTNPGEPSRRDLMQENSSLPLLKVGSTEGNSTDGGSASISYPCDLPRKNNSPEANIVDPRNDENLLLAQTLLTFIKFHNAMVVNLNKLGKYDKKELFDKARKLTIRYYQTIILTDFLPRIVQTSAIEAAMPQCFGKKSFYQPDLFIPLEFSVAAFRFGHSMIREKYNLNIRHNDTDFAATNSGAAFLFELMKFTGRGKMGTVPSIITLPPIINLPSIWTINWSLFYDIGNSPFNPAEPINTEISLGLLTLRPKVDAKINSDGRASSLSALDLYRGRRFGLPTGQDIAAKIGVNPLAPEQIAGLIKNKKVTEINLSQDEENKIKERLCTAFAEKSPLWFYILAEAEIQNDGKLGDVGSRIVAETIIQLIYYSEYSILQEDWENNESFLLGDDFFAEPKIKNFKMPEMMEFIKNTNEKFQDTLYPQMKEKFDELDPLGAG